MKRARFFHVAVLVIMAGGAVGCNTVPLVQFNELELEYNQLDAQNQDLRGQLAAVQTSEAEMKAELAIQRQRALKAEADAASLKGDLARKRQDKPAPEGWEVVSGGAQVSIGSDVLFGSGLAKITAAGRKRVAEVARTIKQRYPGSAVQVFGHTDSDPIRRSKWKDNLELSAQRAMAVTRELIKAGVPAKGVETTAMGPHHPIASNSTRGGKAKNRRVVVMVLK